jgi:hypothetical protein
VKELPNKGRSLMFPGHKVVLARGRNFSLFQRDGPYNEGQSCPDEGLRFK